MPTDCTLDTPRRLPICLKIIRAAGVGRRVSSPKESVNEGVTKEHRRDATRRQPASKWDEPRREDMCNILLGPTSGAGEISFVFNDMKMATVVHPELTACPAKVGLTV